jgi:hypothetical protein
MLQSPREVISMKQFFKNDMNLKILNRRTNALKSLNLIDFNVMKNNQKYIASNACSTLDYKSIYLDVIVYD